MNPGLKKILTLLISLIIGGVFMWLALRGLELEKIQGYFLKANYLWVFAAAVFGVAAYWFRAVRWNLLLEPLGHRVSHAHGFWAIAFGYLMNLTIPRSGEVARATALYGVEKVPVDQSFGTIILERVVDLIFMMLFLGLTFFFKYEAILAFYQQANFSVSPGKIFLVLSVLAAGAGLFFLFRNRFRQVPLLGKVIAFLEGILSGVLSIFKLKHPAKFLLYSLGIWICYYFAAYLVCFALPETADFTTADGFFIVVVGTLGMMVPASGGIGAFHFALKLGIGALFLSLGKDFSAGEEVGLAYAFISHTMQLVIMLVLGIISIPMLAKKGK